MKCPRIIIKNLLLILTIIGVFAGFTIGLVISVTVTTEPKLTPRQVEMLQFPGTLFVRALKLLILPLITSSLINSIAHMDPESAGRIGGIATLYYMTTTLIAVVTGIVLVTVIQPGRRGDGEEGPIVSSGAAFACGKTMPIDTIMNLVRNMVPDNIIDAMTQSVSPICENAISRSGGQ